MLKARTFAMAALTLLLLLGLAAQGHANGQEGPDAATEQLAGPATVGTMTITPGPGGLGILISFTGRCQNQDVVLPPTLFPVYSFGAILAEGADKLLERRLPNGTSHPSVAACYTRGTSAGPVTGDLIVNTVTRFTPSAEAVIADVVLLAVVPR